MRKDFMSNSEALKLMFAEIGIIDKYSERQRLGNKIIIFHFIQFL
jgi:hypothetical protein